MPATTTRLALPYPLPADSFVLSGTSGAFDALAARLDAIGIAWSTGVLASRPAAGNAGFLYFATDTDLLYYDNGTAWVTINASGLEPTSDLSAIATANPTAGNVSMNGYKLTNVANGVSAGDAVNVSQLPTFLPPRSVTLTASGVTYTPNCSTTDVALIASPGAAFTIANPTGSPGDGQRLLLRVRSGSTGYAATWGSAYTSSGVASLPLSAFPASKCCTFGFVYDVVVALWVLLAADTTGY